MTAYLDALRTLKKAPSRIIREHRVYGQIWTTSATSAEDAKDKASRLFSGNGWACWEVTEVSPGTWECYIAKHEDCFATND